MGSGADQQGTAPPRDGFGTFPDPEPDQVRKRIEELVENLRGGIDEGSGGSLDPLIESWAGGWIATVESEYADHCSAISAARGRFQQRLTEATVAADHEREKRDLLRWDYLASRSRLTGESPDPGTGSPPGAMVAPGPGPAPREDWSAPHLVAGRGWWGVVALGVLIVIGALADTLAFRTILDVVLNAPDWVVWSISVGATSMSLVAAGTIGVTRAAHRRRRHWTPRHRHSRLPLVAATVTWLGLGLAMFLIRWRDSGASGASYLPGTSPLLVAAFFAGIYLISGTCTLFEAERLHNPDYTAFRRLGGQYSDQAKAVASADAVRDQAAAALEQHDGELQREDHRRLAAIAARKALAAEAANYARIRMAVEMRNPAATGITETGPIPDMPSSFGFGPGAPGSGP